ncbi:MAG TPA: hypothetical protein VEC39_17285 [Vicinamibacterales bacterium]|nr:hypothetical protein [Vicinamibacterales bacterium]
MKFGLTLGAMLLAANVAAAQVAIDMATLERRYEDAQAQYDRNPTNMDRQQLDDLRDELGYLRIKQRRGEVVSRAERQRFADNLDRFLTRNASTSGRDRNQRYENRDNRDNRIGSMQRLEIPGGSEVDVRLVTPLSSDTTQVEDRVEATTLIDLYRGNELLVPAGSTLLGWVTSVDRASRTDRKGELTIEFNRLRINNRTYDARAYVTQALESEGIKAEAGRIGAGAGIGAIIGGILGGTKGAIAGILIGGGGVIAATEGKDVHLPEGTVLRVRFDSSVPLGY